MKYSLMSKMILVTEYHKEFFYWNDQVPSWLIMILCYYQCYYVSLWQY